MNSSKKYYITGIKWLGRYVGPYQTIILLSILTGLVSGFSAIVLKTLLHYIERNAVKFFPSYLLFLTPLAGILIVTLLHKRVFKTSSTFHGVGNIVQAISKKSALLHFSLTYAKLITSAITVGFGGSSGLESPIVVTGSAIGSNIARFFRLDINYRILFIGCGAASGIAAIFNAPIAGVVFAMEVIMPKLTATYFIPVLLSAAFGSLLAGLFSSESLFTVVLTQYETTIEQVPYYTIIAVAGGLLSVYFTQMSWGMKTLSKKISNDYLRALVGGSALGLMVLFFPRLYGEGYTGIYDLFSKTGVDLLPPMLQEKVVNMKLVVPLTIILLMLLKPIASSLTINSGGDGGQFAPAFITGGYMGYAVYLIAAETVPGFNLPAVVFILLGMAALLSGVMHAPLTGIFLVAEITGGYSLLVPLMLVSAVSFFTKIYFEKRSIHYHKDESQIQQQEHEWATLNNLDLLRLTDDEYQIFHPEQPLAEMLQAVAKSRRNFFPVLDAEKNLLGIITLDDLRPVMFEAEKNNACKAKDLMHLSGYFIDAEDKMLTALEKFDASGIWNLPVLKEGKFTGFISKSTLLDKMRKELGKESNLF
jgi:CIC family chloride channel protein